jgi:alpha-methylacyl-CoA racemase
VNHAASGPLVGLRVVEFAGIGPAPFCAMLLSDLGADVVRIDRPGTLDRDPALITERGRRSVVCDLKSGAGVSRALSLCERADILIEGFRPGVMERLGLGPEVVLARNPRLVYGRMTGFGQDGPLAHLAGHDINYIAISGALAAIGPSEKPMAPLNLVGDLGGGALYLAFGLLAALFHARETGHGQVVDAAMSDGAASLMNMIIGKRIMGAWNDGREANDLDGGAPFYNTYQCACGGYIAVGAYEPHFYGRLLDALGVEAGAALRQHDEHDWPAMRGRLASIFLTQDLASWQSRLQHLDVCVSPVLAMSDAPSHPHNKARQTFVTHNGHTQPAPAPRFSRTPGSIQGPPPRIGSDEASVWRDWAIET